MTELLSESSRLSTTTQSFTGLQDPVATTAQADDALQPAGPGEKPRPGLAGAIAWAASVPLCQTIVSVPLLLLAGIFLRDAARPLRLTVMMTGMQTATLLFAIGAGIGCTWLARHKVFDLAPIRILHLVALVGLVLPASMVSRAFYEAALVAWNQLTALVPALTFMDQLNTMDQIPEIISSVPLPLLLFLMAVVPAVAEEIIFRGIVGRGLIARHGIVSGIVLTSIVFGIAHVHPVHAASVVPLGACMHVLYVCTRSFWAPVMFHFCNNGFALVGAAIAFDGPEPVNAQAAPDLPWWVLLAAITSCAAWFYALAQTRTRLVTEDGSEWNPGYASLEVPREIPTRRVYPDFPLGPVLAAAVGGMAFFFAMGAFGAMHAAEQAKQAGLEAVQLMLHW